MGQRLQLGSLWRPTLPDVTLRWFDIAMGPVDKVCNMTMTMKHQTALVALVLMGAALAVPSLANNDPDPMDLLLAKADPKLIEDLEAGKDTGFEVILSGPVHEEVGMLASLDRAQAMDELRQSATPFLQDVESVATASGGQVVADWPAVPAVKVTGDLALLKKLAQNPDVRHMVADHEEAVRIIDPIESEGGPGALNKEGRHMINAEELWDLGYRGAGVTVSTIDTGIDATHEAFKNADGSSRVEKFGDCVSGGCDDVAPYDDHGHGTHVSGTVLGTNLYDDPEWGVYQEVGVAPEASLIVAKFLSGGGGGSWEGAMDALQWSFDEGADITSNSWGGGCAGSVTVIELIRNLNELGMLSVFAAGNSGSFGINGPGCGEYLISVGAVDANENIAGFSSRGPCEDPDTKSGSRICPDVVAKGVDVRSAIPRSGAGWADASGYRNWQGTSMATPHVAGAAALITEMKKDLTGEGWDTPNREERQLFKDTAKDLGADGPDNNYGWGLVQLGPIASMLDPTDGARVVGHLSVTDPEIRLTEQTFLRFHVRNLGEAVASGTFEVELEDPDGHSVFGVSSTQDLGLLDGAEAQHTFSSTDPLSRGTYTWRGSFDYSWTDPDTGLIRSETIERSGQFVLRAVVMEMTVEGLDESTMIGNTQELVWTATNEGNDFAQGATVEFTVPTEYEFVPGDNFDPQVEESRYADPTPDAVQQPLPIDDVTLVFEVGDVPVGDSFSFTTNLLPLVPGGYALESFAAYADGIGQSFTETRTHTQEVTITP